MTTRYKLSFIAVLFGLVLVAASFIFPGFIGGSAVWKEDQAAAYSVAAGELHRLTYEAGAAQELAKQRATKGSSQAALADARLADASKNGAPVDPAGATAERLASQLEIAKEKYRQQRAALDSARSRGSGTASAMFWIGLIAAAIGLCSLAATAGQESED